METAGLMKYDWVMVENKPVQIQDINYNSVVYYSEEYEHTFGSFFFESIPLTAEMLELNGWYLTQYWREYQNDKCTLQAQLPDIRGKFNGVEIQNLKCEYVHQFQQILRCCGLSEMANNFKVQ